MELQDAISQAISFAKQALQNDKLTVEEVEHDDSPPAWRITVGFKRALPPKRPIEPLGSMASLAQRYGTASSMYTEFEDVYKMIMVPEDGSALSMKIRKV